MKTTLAVLLMCLILMAPTAGLHASGCGYSSYSYSGYYPSYGSSGYYKYYGAGYYGGTYYGAGYYPAYPPVVNVAAFIPYLSYQPVAFSTYQPTVAAPAVALNPVAPVTQPAAADPCQKHIAKFESRIALLEALLTKQAAAPVRTAPEPIPPPQQPRGQAPASGLGVMVAKCAKCHDAAVAKEKGDGLALLDKGQVAVMTNAMILGCFKQVLNGKMPKNDRLTEEEGNALLDFFGQMKAAK